MTSTSPSRRVRAACLAAALALAACSQVASNVAPHEPDAGTVCSLDGMHLNDFPGPKAQVQYAEGAADYFCDLMELFAQVLAPEQKRSVAGVFVQDMGAADWTAPRGHWIDARKAWYVVGSRKQGSMGPTFGSFATDGAAQAFAQKEGGKVLRFEQITLDMTSIGHGAGSDSAH